MPRPPRPCQVEWRASSYCSKAVDAFQWLGFEADLSLASRQTFALEPGGAVRVLRDGTLHGSARVKAHAPTATHSKFVIAGESELAPGALPFHHAGCRGSSSACSMLKLSPWQCPSSAIAAPRGAPGGSGKPGSPLFEAQPLGPHPPPQLLELAASKVADCYRL